MDEMSDTIERAIGLLASVAHVDFATLDDEAVCALTVRAEQAGRLVDAVRARSAAELDRRSRFELGSDGLAFRLGHRRTAHLLEQLTRVSEAEAARRVWLGTAIAPRYGLDGQALPAPHPQIAAAMTAGVLGVDAATQIVRALTQAARTAAPERLEAAERQLVADAAHESADLVAVRARVWREALDPDGAQPREEELRERRRFSLGREAHGLTPFSGACDPVFAGQLRAAFAESNAPDATPRFLDAEDLARGTTTTTTTTTTPDGEVIERISDPRTREQRQLDVLMGLVTAGIRSTGLEPGGMRSTATVMVVVSREDFESGRGAGWIDDVDEPISATTVRELDCDAGHRQIVLGDDGEVLHQGRLQRFFTPAQRRALAVRDGGCVWPQCTAPPSWCHAHHVEEWKANGRNGPTDIDNGVLLCPVHHHMLHNSPFIMAMVRGRPRLLAPPWIDPEQVWRALGRSRVPMVQALVRAHRHEPALS